MRRPPLSLPKSLLRLIKATHYSWNGLKVTFHKEQAFRLELACLVILAPVALWVGESGLEYAVLIGSLLLVLIVEQINSAIESAVDRAGREKHPLSEQAKDMGSAAVFLALINILVVWGLIIFS